MYIIFEIQTNTDGTIGTLVNTAETRNQAESIYHQVLASAALSNLPRHACVLMTNEGFQLMSQCYHHEATANPAPEEPEAE